MKVGEIVVQYPTNVYPDGITFDSTVLDDNNKIAFTFNGDFLSQALYHVYDYDTGDLVLENASGYQSHTPIGYNGTEYSTNNGFLSSLTNGKNYALQILLSQFTANGSEPLCDMFVLRGTTQENYIVNDETITIEDKISSIYEWNPLSEQGWRGIVQWYGVNVAICKIVIGNQKRTITSYQPSTGKATISESFDNNIPAGTKYQIYCNYKVSDLYYFQCRSVPTVDLTLEIANPIGFVHRVTGTYSQAQNSLINYYKIALYWNHTDSDSVGEWIKVDETDNIYSQEIKYDFYDDFVLRYKHAGAETTYSLYYRAVITIVTVDGMTITQKSNSVNCGGLPTVEVPETNIEVTVDDFDRADTSYNTWMPKHQIEISGIGTVPTGITMQIYRENVQTNETVLIESMTDVTVPTKGTFKYYAVPRNSSGHALLKGVSSTTVTLNMRGYTITELIVMDEVFQWGSRPRYKVGDQWKFVGEIQDTTVTQNTDRVLHVGYNTYPTLTRTDCNYMSGTLSAMNGYVDCTTHKYVEDIDLIRAWRDFITRPTIYMLKSQKGDVWIVNITDTPTTTYEENQKDIPTTFSFNWAECCSVNDIKIHPRNSGY